MVMNQKSIEQRRGERLKDDVTLQVQLHLCFGLNDVVVVVDAAFDVGSGCSYVERAHIALYGLVMASSSEWED